MAEVKVAAFMTAPRYEAVFARNVIDRALISCGIPLNVSGGVFYGQCMQKMLTDAVDNGIDYALTLDFDSMFTPEHVRHMLATMNSRDDIDALAAWQSRRGKPFPLLTAGGSTELELCGEPVKVTTAHFGLTLIRVAKLKELPKPWFYSKPTDDGEWVENVSLDDDIWFWHQWAKAGFSVFVDPETRIGHLEEMVSVYDDNMQHRFMYVNDWFKESTRASAAN